MANKSRDKYYYANGRRKTSVARVRLYAKEGPIVVNERPIEEYFLVGSHLLNATEPLRVVEGAYSASIRVSGGGISGQAGAVRLGIARALVGYDTELRKRLKKGAFLTRDARIKERKKYGLAGARKRFQFSKR